MTHRVIYADTDVTRSQSSPIVTIDPALQIELPVGWSSLVIQAGYSHDGLDAPSMNYAFDLPTHSVSYLAGAAIDGSGLDIGIGGAMDVQRSLTGSTLAARLNRPLLFYATINVTVAGVLSFMWGPEGAGTITRRVNSFMEVHS